MLENPTATLLSQGERSLFPKSFLRPEMSTKESKQIKVRSKIVLSEKKKNNNNDKKVKRRKKKHIRNIPFEYSCMVFSTD